MNVHLRSEAASMVRKFHESFGLPIAADPTFELRDLRDSLLVEESNEIQAELLPEIWGDPENFQSWDTDPTTQRERLAKELADGVYVLYGCALSLGIDLDEAVRRVHDSNMSKLGPDGLPIYREDGKVLKGPNYFEPDMTGVAQ
jgi:predicted HAD superfamily Cof-like phosphohydrolase